MSASGYTGNFPVANVSGLNVFTTVQGHDNRFLSLPQSYKTWLGSGSQAIFSIASQSASPAGASFTLTPSTPQSTFMNCLMLRFSFVVKVWVMQTTDLAPNGEALCVIGRDIAVAPANPLGRLVQSANMTYNTTGFTAQNPWFGASTLLAALTPSVAQFHGTTHRQPGYRYWDEAVGTNFSLGSYAETIAGITPPGG